MNNELLYSLMEDAQFTDIMSMDILDEGNFLDTIKKPFVDKKGNFTPIGTIILMVGAIPLSIAIAPIAILGCIGFFTLTSIQGAIKNNEKHGKLNTYSMYYIINSNKNKIAKVEYPKDLNKYSSVYKTEAIAIGKKTEEYRIILNNTKDKDADKGYKKLVDLENKINNDVYNLKTKLKNINNNMSNETNIVNSFEDAQELVDILQTIDILSTKYHANTHHDDWPMIDPKTDKYNDNFFDSKIGKLTWGDEYTGEIDIRFPGDDLKSVRDFPTELFNKIKFLIK